MDTKIQYANQKGLVVVLAGIMDPYQKSLDNCSTSSYSARAVEGLARNLGGRYAGSAVIFSPGFDHKICPYHDQITLAGQTVKAAAPRSLVTDHPAGSSLSSEIHGIASLSWMGLQMYQSGTPSSIPTSNLLENLTGRASQMAIDLSSLVPIVAKPIINGEAAYDGPELGADTNTAYRVRQTAYLSFLSGAVGYTMGACGVFDWGAGRAGCSPHTWQSVVGGLSSRSMGVLRGNLESINWHLLHQEKGRIANQSSSASQAMALSYDRSSALISYLPHEARSITINFGSGSGFAAVPGLSAIASTQGFNSSGWTYRWLSPRSGKVIPPSPNNADLTFVSQGMLNFFKPGCDPDTDEIPCKNDWLLRITRNGSVTLGVTNMLTVSNDPVPESGDSRTHGTIVASDTGSAISDFDIGGDIGSISGRPVTAFETGGNVLVVWESDNDMGSVIDGRIYGPGGSPVTPQFVVSGDAVDAEHPAVTALATGGFAVAWSRSDPSGDGPWIYYKVIAADGAMGGDVKAVNCVPLEGDYPMLAGDNVGGLRIAWQASDGSGIYVLNLDSMGGASEGYAAQGTGGQPFLEGLDSATVLWSSYRPDGTLTSPNGGETTDVVFQPSMCR